MAWTSPKTAIAFEELSAEEYNTSIRNNFREVAPAKAQTPGSVFTTVAGHEIAETDGASLSIESDDDITLGDVASNPKLLLTRQSTQAIPNDAVTQVTGFAAIHNDLIDGESMLDGDQVIVRRSGIYDVGSFVVLESGGTSGIDLSYVFVNPFPTFERAERIFYNNSYFSENIGGVPITNRGVLPLAEGDVVQFGLYQDTGASRDLLVSPWAPRWWLRLIPNTVTRSL